MKKSELKQLIRECLDETEYPNDLGTKILESIEHIKSLIIVALEDDMSLIDTDKNILNNMAYPIRDLKQLAIKLSSTDTIVREDTNFPEIMTVKTSPDEEIKEKMVDATDYPISTRTVRENNDTIDADELTLYIDNNADLYRQQVTPIIQNLKRKIKNGIYDPILALKLWGYLADNGAKRYHKEFGDENIKWFEMFPKNVRLEVAKELQDHYDEELKFKDA